MYAGDTGSTNSQAAPVSCVIAHTHTRIASARTAENPSGTHNRAHAHRVPVHVAVVDARAVKRQAQPRPEGAEQRLVLGQHHRHLEHHLCRGGVVV
jgi:hypothetical protein